MRFKVDENLPTDVAQLLVEAGHDAETVWAKGMQGQPDEALVATCRSEDRVLVTVDLDFADVRTYPPTQSPGFIVLRPYLQDKGHVLSLWRRTIPLLGVEPVEHRLWIVEEDHVRIRGE